MTEKDVAYVVQAPNNRLLWFTISVVRKKAIENFTAINKAFSWRYYNSKGYKTVAVGKL